MTAANRAQRRHPKAGIAQIAKAAEEAFTPVEIGSITVAELRQLKIREEIIGALDAQQKELEEKLRILSGTRQIVMTEATTFVTNVANTHGAAGAQCQIDSDSGAITQIQPSPKPVPEPVELQLPDEMTAENPPEE